MDASQVITAVPKTLIRLYQRISAGPVRTCRFYPTCSDYAIHAFEEKGFWGGLWFTARRLLKCHPWHPGGYDPISNMDALN
jgi:uncharacterized protein